MSKKKQEKDELTKITTPKFRVSFPAVFIAKAYKNGLPVFSIVMLFDEKLAAQGALNNMQNLIKATAIEKWGEVPKEVLDMSQDTCPFNDGNLKSYDGYENTYYARAASQFQPAVIDTGDIRKSIEPSAILAKEEFYSGCYARASITAYGWESMGRKGVSFGLQNVQKLADGEPFSGRGDPLEDFDPIVPEEMEVADSDELFGGGSVKKDSVEEL